MEGSEKRDRDEVFSKIVRAGKRTYFFDVKKTRKKDDFYLTITESKKRFGNDGEFRYEKHKIFLYKEDFDKFREAFLESTEFVNEAVEGKIEIDSDGYSNDSELNTEEEVELTVSSGLTDVDFDDLGK
ncbi:DUF3276 family protein [Saccharicrinis sp. FJH62]|uniref:DUF3276 family protein n=1 Tax=Saccharicrinis sp. FJH62 TaxID=3344657 RepID=UPI0035D411CE